jgi:hypothetical protein
MRFSAIMMLALGLSAASGLAQDIPPAPPADLPGGTEPAAAAPACSTSDYGFSEAACDLSCFESYDDAWCGAGCCDGSICGRRCGRCCRLDSTGDMYPHYPYQPMYHGYYYFRPYNWTMVERQRSQAVAMGFDIRAPYATGPVFGTIYGSFDQGAYAETKMYLPRFEPKSDNKLPELETLLRK